MKIREIVSRNKNTQFVNDVQISSFRSQLNSELAGSYIFTSRSGAGRRSSTSILENVVQSYLPGGVDENRFVVIATYGHGKSHFGLAMANYFGQPAGSPVLEAVLANLRHGAPDDAAAEGFRTFRQNKPKPFLVLILRGDETGSLRQRALRGLEAAFADADETKGVKPPSWFQEAERLLNEVVLPRKVDAEAWLAQHEMSLSVLQARISSRDDAVYTLFGGLVRALTRVEANLQARTNLGDLVRWTCDTFCGTGDDRPFSGLLVLFDEFSTFVAEYAGQSADGTPLQELLNGVSDRRGQAAFVALAQHDPDVVAANELRFDGGNTRLESIKRELDRLPGPFRFRMYSSLETVLSAYLRQDDRLMHRLLSERRTQQAIAEATDLAYDVYRERYAKRLSWTPEKFQQNVTLGCFPLHPLATAIISDIDLQMTTNPRSILGFVLEALERKASEDVVDGNSVNWILPVALVDYFKDMLGSEWAKYRSAVSQVGPDQPVEYHEVLKAMLLQAAAQMPTARAGGYARVIASLAGVTAAQAEQALRRLHTPGYIRLDPQQHTYSFWPENQGAYLIEQRLADLADVHPLTSSVMQEINELLLDDKLLGRVEPSTIQWGNPTDWAASEYVVRAAEVEYRHLNELAAVNAGLASDRQRAVVVYVVAQDEQDVEALKDRVPEALDHQYGPRSEAIVAFRPTMPLPEAVRGLYRYWLLRKRFTNRLQADVGQALYEEEVERFKQAAEDILGQLRSNSVAIVPAKFRASIAALHRADSAQIVSELERLAYFQNPGSFVTNQKLSSTNLRNAVWSLALPLARNALGANRAGIRQQPMADDILKQHLMQHWGVVTPDYRLQVPDGKPAHDAWKQLDAAFPPSKDYTSAEPVVLQLLSRPFGLDTNTLTLLLCSWIGFNRADLVLAVQEARGFDELIDRSKRPKDFIAQFAQVRLRRLDPDAVRDEVRGLVNKLKAERVSIQFAERGIERLEEILGDKRLSSADTLAAKQAVTKLKADLEIAGKYDEIASSIGTGSSDSGMQSRLVALRSVEKLPACGVVQPSQPGPAEIREQALHALSHQVEREITDALDVDGLPAYQAGKAKLDHLKYQLAEVGLEDLVRKAGTGLAELERIRAELVALEEDGSIIRALEAATVKSSLIDLRKDEQYLDDLIAKAQSSEARNRVSAHLAATRARIAELMALAADLQQRARGIASLNDLESAQTELARKYALFEGTPEQGDLKAVADNVAHLRGKLAELAELAGSPFKSAAAADEIKERLAALEETMPYEAQKNLCSTAASEVDRRVRSERESALRWFKTTKDEFDSAVYSRQLLSALEAPPPFLSDEHLAAVRAMLAHATDEVEKDEVERLVNAFMMIESRERRRQCLERLNALGG